MSSQVRILLSPHNSLKIQSLRFKVQNSVHKTLNFEFKVLNLKECESSSVGRASAFQAECRRFEPGLSLENKSNKAGVAQLVERILGRDEVVGSSPIAGSINKYY